jgi:hypothetical protein
MEKKQIENLLNELTDILAGAEILWTRGGVEINRFDLTADWRAAKAALEAHGIACGPNCAYIHFPAPVWTGERTTDRPEPAMGDPYWR